MSPDQQAWAEHLALISRLDPKELLSCFPDLPQERNHFWVTVYAACIILTDSLPKATNISEVTDWHIVRGKAQTILHRHKVRLRRHTKQFHYNGKLFPIPSYLLGAKTVSPDELRLLTINQIRTAAALHNHTLLADATPEQLFHAIPDDKLAYLLTLRNPNILLTALSTAQLTMELENRINPIVASTLSDADRSALIIVPEELDLLALVKAREEQEAIRQGKAIITALFCAYCATHGHDIDTCPEKNVHLAEASAANEDTFIPTEEELGRRVIEE